MPTYYAKGGPTESITSDEIRSALEQVLSARGQPSKILIIPPDATRSASYAILCLTQRVRRSSSRLLPGIRTDLS